MDVIKDLLAPATAAIIAGIVLAILAWLYNERTFVFTWLEPIVTRPWALSSVVALGTSVLTSYTMLTLFKQPTPPVPSPLPKGLVVASTSQCDHSRGWQDYADGVGRFIIGADPPDWPKSRRNLDESRFPLSEREFKASGGWEQFTIKIENLPRQEVTPLIQSAPVFFGYHPTSQVADNHDYQSVGAGPQPPNSQRIIFETNGGGKELRFLPPYKALYYCLLE
jgi:hypothetical protein